MAHDPASHLQLVDRLRLAQEIAKLVRARLPLEKALNHLAANTQGTLSESIAAVNQRLQAGHSLADSLARGDDRHARMLRACVSLGESSGKLDQALDYWASYHLTRQRLLRSLASALFYPLMLVVVALVSIMFSAWKLLPQYEQAFAQLAVARPNWLIILQFVEQNFVFMASGIVLGTILVLWRSLGNRQRLDRLGVPRNPALKLLHYSQVAKMSSLGVRSGQPVQAWLEAAMQSVGLTIDHASSDLLADGSCSHWIGKETSSVLMGLQAGQLPATESESLLMAIADNGTVQAEFECERLVHRLPMLTSIVVGTAAAATYLGLIYLPWLALFYHIALPA